MRPIFEYEIGSRKEKKYEEDGNDEEQMSECRRYDEHYY